MYVYTLFLFISGLSGISSSNPSPKIILHLQNTRITVCYTVILLLTHIYSTGLPRPKRRLQHNYVGTLHTRANSRPLDGQSLHHEYGVEFLGDGAVWDGCVPRGCWWALVVGGCDDGCRVYFGRDAGGGLAFG